MAYHGYVPLIKKYISRFKTPSVLEVGLDRGITTIPIVAHLSRTCENFFFLGIDVLIQESLRITLSGFDYSSGQNVTLLQENSLNVLPELVERNVKFDVFLLDGDHNYYTVAKELECLNLLTHDFSMVIIDDYHGRWSEKDLWYANREGYETVESTTKPIETMKHGVKPAVDEFVLKNPEWDLTTPIVNGEPVVLMKKFTKT